MTITIAPQFLSGSITPPSSKSQSHRLIVGAALAAGKSCISSVSDSQDISATLRCMEGLGAKYQWETAKNAEQGVEDAEDAVHCRALRITGIARRNAAPQKILDCGESGSTLRFLIPIALAVAGGGVFTGHGRLMQRPQTPYFEMFEGKGIDCRVEAGTLRVHGTLRPGKYSIRGDVSSQFITGLLYALPLLNGDSDIVLTTPLESAGYVDMTLQALRQFGISIQPAENGWHTPGNQTYFPADVQAEADWSQAGFFLAAKGMGNDLTISGLSENSTQGDRIAAAYFRRLNGPGRVELDVSGCPDLAPPLAARAALRPGQETRITGAARLRIKESDRLASVTAVLNAMGADVRERPDSLTIFGKEILAGGVTVDSWNDHRIAMMAAIAATKCEKPVTITGADSVKKSYPDFWADYRRLGGDLWEESE